ncbi:MAG: hypothetical protein QF357_09930 [Dehalococcoidia bacterium]|nr:hypothetical protein [Dehalococcoidia bacterium]
MPNIDVSQNSYRALIRAAHRARMSLDRFIQYNYGEESAETKAATAQSMVPPAPVPAGTPTPSPATGRSQTRQPAGDDPAFEALWGRIELNAGEEISTKRGRGFTYEVESGYLTVRDSGARIPRSQFKKALDQWPKNGPSTMRGIYAPSVVWAVLADEQILGSAA